MRLQPSSCFRTLMASLLVVLSLAHSGDLQASETRPLSKYAIEQFGHPPAVPDGPVTGELRAALQVAFIDTVTQQSWGESQSVALLEISK